MRVYYTHKLWHDCQLWSANAGVNDQNDKPLEVGWFGEAKMTAEGNIYILNANLFEQEVSPGSFEVSAATMAKFYEKLIAEGGDPGTINYFGHSHVWMNAFQSDIDRKNVMDRFSGKDWCIAVTHNLKGEAYAELTVFQPFKGRFESIPVQILPARYNTDDEEVARVAALVSRKSYAAGTTYGEDFQAAAPYSNKTHNTLTKEEEDLLNVFEGQHFKLKGYNYRVNKGYVQYKSLNGAHWTVEQGNFLERVLTHLQKAHEGLIKLGDDVELFKGHNTASGLGWE